MWNIWLIILLSVILIVVIGALSAVVVRMLYAATCKSNRRLDGKTTLVTGGTLGMGLETATEFARRGAKVIIACPFQEEGENAKKMIIENTGNEKVIFKFLNLASFASVREFAEEVLKTEDRLDILVNNAGVVFPDTSTEDGMSFIMQVNYFGHFLLTLLLLPLLKSQGKPSEPSRIVNISSMSHAFGKINIETLNKPNRFPGDTYMRSKLCLAMLSRELTKRMTALNVVINTADPGLVATTIIEKFGTTYFVLKYFFRIAGLSPWEGAQTAIHVALDPRAGEVSGEYFRKCQQARAGLNVYDDMMSQRLWEKSIEIVKLSNSEMRRNQIFITQN